MYAPAIYLVQCEDTVTMGLRVSKTLSKISTQMKKFCRRPFSAVLREDERNTVRSKPNGEQRVLLEAAGEGSCHSAFSHYIVHEVA